MGTVVRLLVYLMLSLSVRTLMARSRGRVSQAVKSVSIAVVSFSLSKWVLLIPYMRRHRRHSGALSTGHPPRTSDSGHDIASRYQSVCICLNRFKSVYRKTKLNLNKMTMEMKYTNEMAYRGKVNIIQREYRKHMCSFVVGVFTAIPRISMNTRISLSHT